MLVGKVLMGVGGMPNGFSTHGKNFLTFDAAFIRSPPLFLKSESVMMGERKSAFLKLRKMNSVLWPFFCNWRIFLITPLLSPSFASYCKVNLTA